MNDNFATTRIKRRGLLFVLSSPSGAGKTTLAQRLLNKDDSLKMSVSVTTRFKRPGERDGTDYHFIDRERYDRMRARDELLESAEIFDNGYGTPRQPVEDWLTAGKDVLFDIDWQGTQQISQHMGNDLVSVFILPPSVEELRNRLDRRAQDPKSVVAKRMAEAGNEISHWPEYDYVVVNDNADRCEQVLSTILAAERMKRHRRTGLADFVSKLRDEL